MHAPVVNENETANGFLFGRRAAWFAYGMTVVLMIFDYVDRQVIVSMFPLRLFKTPTDMMVYTF